MKTLKEARLAAGKTQLDIQRDTGIFQTKLSLEENGSRSLTVLEMMTLERHLGTEINWVQQNPLTPEQQAELSQAIFNMSVKFGQLETLKFTSRFRSVSEMFKVLCRRTEQEEPLELPNYSEFQEGKQK
ncbi:MAG: XRE family transcriptional regulator [Dehalococcoidia bacterium]|nr:MAG: XRE family transcriptional regulator [Dehalococcoidia bacterium]